jgi:hypothetical protein
MFNDDISLFFLHDVHFYFIIFSQMEEKNSAKFFCRLHENGGGEC